MLPFYQALCEQFKWKVDTALVETMKAEIEKKVKELNDTIADAEENLGESEVREGFLARADFYCRIGDKEKAIQAFRETTEKTVGLGQKLDILFTLIRLGFFWNDDDLVTRNIEKAKRYAHLAVLLQNHSAFFVVHVLSSCSSCRSFVLVHVRSAALFARSHRLLVTLCAITHSMIEQGGDWDRRNRLKVYEALYNASIRKFSEAATLFLEGLATFTSYELCTYNHFIFYAILMSAVSIDRVNLKKKVTDAPEVLAVIRDPELSRVGDLINSIYNSEYATFFQSLGTVSHTPAGWRTCSLCVLTDTCVRWCDHS
jgi:26S proteasome regulatory subunit N7